MKTSAILLGLGASIVSAHMEMTFPAPFRSKSNDNVPESKKVYDMTSPLNADGSNFPCKGYLSDIGTAEGASTANFALGETYKYTISGGAAHNGGSCQASLSFDGGKTWTVIQSHVGNCPVQGESDFEFAIPDDTPTGEAIFSWSWFNKVGNREMYQNCAAVTIGGGSSKVRKSKRATSDSFSSRPEMFVANVGNGCTTVEGSDLEFPNPGPDVNENSEGTAPPSGSCSSGGGSGGGSGEGDGDDGNTGGGDNDGNEPNPGIPSAPPAQPSTPPSDGDNEPNPGIPSQGAPNPGIPSQEPANPPPAQPTEAPVESPSATIPGGVFITQPADDENDAPSTTMMTLTNPVATPPAATPGVEEPPAQEPPAQEPPAQEPPVENPAAPVPTPDTGNGSGAGVMPQGEACTNEGEWNCVNGGSAFQRCASGQWSAIINMAAGTTCQEGMSANFSLSKERKGRALRFARSRRF